ncbi:hypothetical protein [Rheinheimera sp. F8]|uniref:hypothetical protein n=1 Tax=Rheinheimera sp. F8 TaxID=1763998 RepID=UPI000744B0B7|nr:hypothetical protein [Rheinheimera sp. F8]ALZ76153.1 hypothetical protein ATY27_10510 [Rheinheimera sp. F8]ALZ77666.1 hypothetical protein ATY27_19145 [Rheinheimera sp. F8]
MKDAKPAYELCLEQQTLWVRAIGVWTSRDIREYIGDFRDIVQPIIDRPWALVLDVRDWQTSPKEIFAGVTDNSNWCVQHGLAHVIALLPADHVIGWQFLKATAIEMPDALVRQRADTADEARRNLFAAGFLEVNVLPEDQKTG